MSESFLLNPGAPKLPVSSNLFNPGKVNYEDTPLILGTEAPGLFDTLNKRFPEVWKQYKNLKSLDWDENEFTYTSCNIEFKTCKPATYEMMIRTLAWQWEADSLASRAVAPIMACYNPGSELWAAYSAIGTNEILHAATYSEIVRSSFDDPSVVLGQILKMQEALQRMDSIAAVMKASYIRAHRFALGDVPNDQETYNSMYLMVVAMYLLERVQFASSFAITFSIADSGLFVPIGNAVQKVAQDELEVHAEVGKIVLMHEHTTERGRIAKQQCKDIVQAMVNDVGRTEMSWNQNLFSEGRELIGMNERMLSSYTLFQFTEPLEVLDAKAPMGMEIPKTDPLPFMADWLDISRKQAAVQEQQNGQYKLNIMERDDEELIFDVCF